MLLLSGLLAAIFLVTTRNPVSNRFTEILNTDMNLVKQDKYNPGIYFNDVQFRMVQWKFVNEILNENHCWWIGISPGDAQNLLDKKYIEKNMYTGDPSRGDHGYLRYNTHDQILESLLQSGIAGMLLFLLVLFAVIRLAWRKKNLLLRFTVALLIAFSLIESVFETQYALMVLIFFPLFLNSDEKEE
jgi:O-antigen ligase